MDDDLILDTNNIPPLSSGYDTKPKPYQELYDTCSDLKEINRLLSRSLLRCAKDLKHALSYIRGKEREEFEARSDMWMTIGSYPDGYRDQLHRDISNKEVAIDRYKKILKDNNIIDPEELPF